MKYEESCICGAKMKMDSTMPSEIARTKAQWKIDHQTHSQDEVDLRRKTLVMEYQEMQARITAVAEQTHPAMVVAYELAVTNKGNPPVVLYQATLYPGNGFHWDDPNSPITIDLIPTTMKLPDLENKALAEAEANKSPTTFTFGPGAKGQATLEVTADSLGNMTPPFGSVLNPGPSKKAATVNKMKEMLEVQEREKLVEQRKQSQSKRDKGATKTTGVATRSRIRRNDVGRRGNL